MPTRLPAIARHHLGRAIGAHRARTTKPETSEAPEASGIGIVEFSRSPVFLPSDYRRIRAA